MFLSEPIPVADSFIDKAPIEIYNELLNKNSEVSRDAIKVSKKETLRIIELKNEALRVATLQSFHANFSLLKKTLQLKSNNLDTIFNFSTLVLSGGSILPPVIFENNNRVNKQDDTMVVTKRSFSIRRPAKLVSSVPTWRDYIIPTEHVMPPQPANEILPTNEIEKKAWIESVKIGWLLGKKQAEDEFVQSIRRLTSDYLGMVRYTVLYKKNIITAPYVSITNLGITNSDNDLNIGQSEIRLIQPSFFKNTYKAWNFIPHFKQ